MTEQAPLAATHESPSAPLPSDRPWAWPDWLIVALVIAPFLVGVVAVVVGVGSGFHALADNALNELRVRDIGRWSVLLGPYSRDGWSHPGPAMYYALVLPYRLFGSHSSSLLAGALLLNGAASGATVVIARRIGGRPAMAVTAFALSIVTLNLGALFVRDPWNPYLTVLPFALLFVAAWGLALGRIWFLPLLAFVTTFEVQTHIGYLPIAGAIVAWAVVAWALAWRRGRREHEPRPSLRTPVLVTIAILVVMWAPPIVDQLTDSGNLNTARIYFTRGTATRGLQPAARIVEEAFTLAPNWLVGGESASQFSGEPSSVLHPQLPILAALFLGVLALTWRRQSRVVRQLAIGLTVASVTAVLALARTPGLIYDYRLRWIWLLGALTFATTVWMAAHAWVKSRRGFTVIGAAVGVVLVVTGAAASVAATTTEVAYPAYVARMESISRQVLHRVHPAHGSVIVRPMSFVGLFYWSGLVLRLEDTGVQVRVDDSAATRLSFGRHRIEAGEPVRAILSIATDEAIESIRSRPGQHEIAYSGESRARRAHDAVLLQKLHAQAESGDHSAALTRRIKRVTARRQAVAVYESDVP